MVALRRRGTGKGHVVGFYQLTTQKDMPTSTANAVAILCCEIVVEPFEGKPNSCVVLEMVVVALRRRLRVLSSMYTRCPAPHSSASNGRPRLHLTYC